MGFKKLVSLFFILIFLVPSSLFAQLRRGDKLEDEAFSSRGEGASSDSFRERRKDLLKSRGLETGSSSFPSDSLAEGIFYQVHVLGEVEAPGTYKVGPSDRLQSIILKAGDILVGGSERHVELRRQGQPTRKIDLLSFRLLGDVDSNPYLMDNDVVYVPLKKKTIRIVGAVKRQNIYELTENEKNLGQLMNLVGGYTVGASFKKPIKVVRYHSGEKEIIDLKNDPEEYANFVLEDGDVIVVPHIFLEKNNLDYNLEQLPGDNLFLPSFEDRVFVLGGVNDAGPYRYSTNYKVRHYVSLAGGTTKMATKRIRIVRVDGKIQKKINEETVINPGDAIIVGEKRLPPEGWVSIFLGTTTTVLGLTTTIISLTR
ncbi:MAG: SLBB domain-containing protein [Deltaproteobacteria bacterium]|nr:SLBB domain-containing protein [Deltaproteobacteria bacterium]